MDAELGLRFSIINRDQQVQSPFWKTVAGRHAYGHAHWQAAAHKQDGVPVRGLAVFPQRRSIEVVDLAEPPAPTAHQVLLRPLEIGICGTDKEIAAFEYGTPPVGCDHLVIGHEALAEVIEAGPEVEGLDPGDLVVPMVRRPCPHASCTACRQGRQDFCYTGDYTECGIKGAHGFARGRVLEQAAYLHPVPKALRSWAVLTEPLSIAEKALLQIWQIQRRLPWAKRDALSRDDGRKLQALVLGAGPVGLLGAMALTHAGFNLTVYSKESPESNKASIVHAIGGRYLSAQDCGPQELLQRLGRVDLVYEAAGASRIAFEILRVLDRNAVFVFTGVPGRKAPIELDTGPIMRNLVLNNQILLGTVNAGANAYQAALSDLEQFRRKWPHALDTLISGRYDLRDHARLLGGDPGGIKNVFRIADATMV